MMDNDHATAPAVAPEQGGGAAEELAYRLRQQQLTAKYGRFALRTHDTAALLQEATRVGESVASFKVRCRKGTP